jgi:hypothetical protein
VLSNSYQADTRPSTQETEGALPCDGLIAAWIIGYVLVTVLCELRRLINVEVYDRTFRVR